MTKIAIPLSDRPQRSGRPRPRWIVATAIAAAIFGIATLISGGATLFGPQEVREAAGTVVQFVLWFNFLAGFAYLVGAYGLYRQERWALGAAVTIAVATAVVALAFIAYTTLGGAFNWRTPGALLLRIGFWVAVAWGLWSSRRKSAGRHA